jgi:hypothetical protein
MLSGDWNIQDHSMDCPSHTSFDDAGIFCVLNMGILIHDFHLTANTYSQEEIHRRNTRTHFAQYIFDHIDWSHLNSENLQNSVDSSWDEYKIYVFKYWDDSKQYLMVSLFIVVNSFLTIILPPH